MQYQRSNRTHPMGQSHVQDLIADFHKLPRRGTFRSSGALTIAQALNTLTRRLLDNKAIEHAIESHWEHIIGTDLHRRCHPQKIIQEPKGSTYKLRIACENAPIKSELSFNKSKIQKRIRQINKCEKIVAVHFVDG